MTDPRTLADRAKKELAVLVRPGRPEYICPMVVAALDAVLRLVEEVERLRAAAQGGAIRLEDAPTWRPRHFPPGRDLTETPEREG